MIKLKLSFGKKKQEHITQIVADELLKGAVERACVDVPLKPDHKLEDVFNVVVNGNIVDGILWDKIKLKAEDDILITPKLKDGDTGQLFKQALIIAISVIATIYFPPAGGFWNAMAVAGVTLAATLVLNALIPPPIPNLGNGVGGDSIDGSQMYSFSGQSNQLKKLGIVPKVYGTHRIYPPLAANPYIELAVDQNTGEMIQYLCAIYDFGLGSPMITDMRVGDTPLAAESFVDFQHRFVDPNKPDTDRDDFDEPLNKTFQLYRGDRTFTQVGATMEDGAEVIRNSDENPNNYAQEIILDLYCPLGLYGYSSGGTKGKRKITLNIEFAPVGSSSWVPYNDLTYVNNFRSTGGTDVTDFSASPVTLLTGHALFNTYYQSFNQTTTGGVIRNAIYFKPNGSRLLVPKPTASQNWNWQVGGKVFIGGSFIGIINSITDLGPAYPLWYDLQLDRSLANKWEFWAYVIQTEFSIAVFDFVDSFQTQATLNSSLHALGAGTVEAESTSPVYACYRFTPKDPGQYKVRVKRTATTGAFTQQVGEVLTWTGITTSFDNSPIKTTKRHVFLELKIKATDQLNGHIQNLSGIASQPLEVYDPNTETWSRALTSNPAWVFVDLLTNEINKKAVEFERLHLDSIVAWADYCAEIPTPPPDQEFTEPRFASNFIFDYAATLQEVLQQVGSSAQASLNIVDGKYGVLVDRFKTTPSQIFTPRNSRGFSSSRFYAPKPHGLKIKYIDPQLAWEISEAVVYNNGYDVTNAEEFEEMTSFACTNFEQAWRFGRYMLAQSILRQETISLLVDFENLICTRGDYVQVTQDVMQVGGRPARVKAVAGNEIEIDDGLDIDPGIDLGYTYRTKEGEINTSTCSATSPRVFEVDGDVPEVGDLIVIGEVGKLVIDCIVKGISPNDDMSAQLSLVERANEIFDYESTNAMPEYNPQLSKTSNPEFVPPKAVTDLTLLSNTQECAQTQSGYNYYAEINWETPQGSVYEFFEIWANDGRGYRAIATTVSKYFKWIVDQTRLGTLMGLKVVAVSASGKKLQLIAMPEVTFTPETKSTPPSDVVGFGMMITNQVLQLAWQPLVDCDVAKYELRYSPEVNDIWEASVPLQIVDRNVNSISVQARTGVYFIKAIDFAGNKSVNASQANTTIPNLFDLNIIETLNDAPDFDGLMEQAELLGSAVILETRVFGDADTMQFYTDGYYLVQDLIDLGDIYSARLQSLIRADGYRYGELLSLWDHLSDVDHLGTADSDEWNVITEYRATNEILAMADWEHLTDVDHLNEGLGQGFTDWRPIPTIGDATGRVFQFRIHLQSITPNVTPRLFDGTIKVDMPDRTDSFENLLSDASLATTVTYEKKFNGPAPSPNVQISIDGGATGDYWSFDNKDLEGFQIRFFDKNNVQVARTFDVLAKGYGSRHSVVI